DGAGVVRRESSRSVGSGRCGGRPSRRACAECEAQRQHGTPMAAPEGVEDFPAAQLELGQPGGVVGSDLQRAALERGRPGAPGERGAHDVGPLPLEVPDEHALGHGGDRRPEQGAPPVGGRNPRWIHGALNDTRPILQRLLRTTEVKLTPIPRTLIVSATWREPGAATPCPSPSTTSRTGARAWAAPTATWCSSRGASPATASG